MPKTELTKKNESIIKESYGNYLPRGWRPFKKLHAAIRKGLNNDEKFLEFLEAQIKDRPVYQSPLIKNNGKETNT